MRCNIILDIIYDYDDNYNSILYKCYKHFKHF